MTKLGEITIGHSKVIFSLLSGLLPTTKTWMYTSRLTDLGSSASVHMRCPCEGKLVTKIDEITIGHSEVIGLHVSGLLLMTKT